MAPKLCPEWGVPDDIEVLEDANPSWERAGQLTSGLRARL
jgi:hypothetical protein